MVRVELGPIAPIETAIDVWRTTIATRRRPVAGSEDPAATLRQRVWEPLEPHLRGVTMLLVSPDGVLNRLPLGALPGSRPERYLLEELAIATVPVPQLVPELVADHESPDAPNVQANSLLTLADVNYASESGHPSLAANERGLAVVAHVGEETRPVWASLAATAQEAATIQTTFARKFPGADTRALKADQATESAFRSVASNYRYIHLATHGFFAGPSMRSALLPSTSSWDRERFDPQSFVGHNPSLLSGLVLAGANRAPQLDRDDGILTAMEVANLNLRGTELAVLSACETGLGATAGGEGVLGLQRAFQLAGVRSTVTSLWKVDDDATRRLMERFYENLWRKQLSKLDSLREAQLWLLREKEPDGIELDRTKGERAPPFYWAAFVLAGDWN